MSPLHRRRHACQQSHHCRHRKFGIWRGERYQAPRKGSLCVIEHIGTAVRDRYLMLRRCDIKAGHASGSRLSERHQSTEERRFDGRSHLRSHCCLEHGAWEANYSSQKRMLLRLDRGQHDLPAGHVGKSLPQQAERKSAVFSKGNPVFSTSNWDHTKPTWWNAPSSSHCPDEAGLDDCLSGAALPETVAALTCPRAWWQTR